MFVIKQHARCPTLRPLRRIRMEWPASNKSRERANSGPAMRLPLWHAGNRKALGTPAPVPQLRDVGSGASIERVCYVELSGNCTTAPLNRIRKKGSNTW